MKENCVDLYFKAYSDWTCQLKSMVLTNKNTCNYVMVSGLNATIGLYVCLNVSGPCVVTLCVF